MKAEILKVIGQLQYEISILDIDEESLTGVDIRTEELKVLVKKLTIFFVSKCLCCNEVKELTHCEECGDNIGIVDN